MDTDTLQRIAKELPVFPLPRVVLMPGELLPLHVFEPRYRALVRFCLDHDGVMGIATLQPGYEGEYHLRPPVYPEIGIGRIVQHQAYPDGRSNIVLEYVGRAQLDEELPERHPFREVRGTVVADDAEGADRVLQRVKLLVLQLGTISADAAREAARMVELDGIEMVDSLARKLLTEPDERRAYLATARIADRVAVVEARLSRFLAVGTGAAEA